MQSQIREVRHQQEFTDLEYGWRTAIGLKTRELGGLVLPSRVPAFISPPAHQETSYLRPQGRCYLTPAGRTEHAQASASGIDPGKPPFCLSGMAASLNNAG